MRMHAKQRKFNIAKKWEKIGDGFDRVNQFLTRAS